MCIKYEPPSPASSHSSCLSSGSDETHHATQHLLEYTHNLYTPASPPHHITDAVLTEDGNDLLSQFDFESYGGCGDLLTMDIIKTEILDTPPLTPIHAENGIDNQQSLLRSNAGYSLNSAITSPTGGIQANRAITFTNGNNIVKVNGSGSNGGPIKVVLPLTHSSKTSGTTIATPVGSRLAATATQVLNSAKVRR